ncbi:DNA polymerase alpha subunit B [Smittium culicis]|uniref:DNA polymerase alpha subunit B n=1 Tax=Smittium culicis TaxID=133412 RepID=A0A1R1YDH3_9FUNG|nr:DNA polymerase alpha subunit B [Smittium culicis]
MPAADLTSIVQSFLPTKVSPQIAEKLINLSNVYDLSINELVSKWQAILFSQFKGDSKVELDEKNFSLLQQKVVDSWQKSSLISSTPKANSTPVSESKRKKKLGISSFDKTNIFKIKSEFTLNTQNQSNQSSQSSQSAYNTLQKRIEENNSSHPSQLTSHLKPNTDHGVNLYKERKNSGNIEVSVSPDNADSSSLASFSDELSIYFAPNSFYGNLESKNISNTNSFRYMVDSLSDRTELLESNTDNLAQAVKSFYGINILNNPRYTTTEDVYVVGRIVGSPDNSYKLSQSSVELATSRRLGTGNSVSLDLSLLESYSLFPGQVVCLLGKNLTGAEFKVSKILSIPFPDSFADQNLLNKTDSFDMISACGPFTTIDSISVNSHFEPLADLAIKILDAPPKLVVLSGPFVGEQIVQYDVKLVHLTPDEIFTNYITPLLNKIASVSKLILVPSFDDMVNPIINFPSPEFSRLRMKELGLNNQVISVPNPCQIIVNGRLISISTADSLVALSGSELGYSTTNFNDKPRMERLAYHLLEQQNFFPVDPVPIQIAPISHTVLINESRNTSYFRSFEDLGPLEIYRSSISIEEDIDKSKDPKSIDTHRVDPEADQLHNTSTIDRLVSPIQMVYTPDIFISPSQLKNCAFYITSMDGKQKKCLFTNPGKLAFGKTGGTYSHFKISDSPDILPSVEIIRI